MTWTTRTVFKKPGGDPLFEFFTSYPHGNKSLLKDPRIISFGIWRNLDRSVGLVYLTWENEESFKQWKLDYDVEFNESGLEAKNWAAERGITILREQPESEYQNWADPKYLVDGMLGYHRAEIAQILTGE